MPNNKILELAVCPLPGILISHMGKHTNSNSLTHTLFPWMRRWLINTELSAQSKFTVSLQDSGNYTHTVWNSPTCKLHLDGNFSSFHPDPTVLFRQNPPTYGLLCTSQHFSIHVKVPACGMWADHMCVRRLPHLFSLSLEKWNQKKEVLPFRPPWLSWLGSHQQTNLLASQRSAPWNSDELKYRFTCWLFASSIIITVATGLEGKNNGL